MLAATKKATRMRGKIESLGDDMSDLRGSPSRRTCELNRFVLLVAESRVDGVARRGNILLNLSYESALRGIMAEFDLGEKLVGAGWD